MLVCSKLVPFYQPAFLALQVYCYPKPEGPTPSFQYVLSFAATVYGIVMGVWRNPLHHGDAARIAIEERRGEYFSISGLAWSFRRFAVGLVLVLASRAIAKAICVFIFFKIPKSIGLNVCFLDQWEKDVVKAREQNKGIPPRPKGVDMSIMIRIGSYAAVGFSVAELSVLLFDAIGI